jgi:hypothetical protein
MQGRFLEWSELNFASWKDYVENFANYANTTLYFEETCEFMAAHGMELLPSNSAGMLFRGTSYALKWQATDPSLVEGLTFCDTIKAEFSGIPRKRRPGERASTSKDFGDVIPKIKTRKITKERIKRKCGRIIRGENNGQLLQSGA